MKFMYIHTQQRDECNVHVHVHCTLHTTFLLTLCNHTCTCKYNEDKITCTVVHVHVSKIDNVEIKQHEEKCLNKYSMHVLYMYMYSTMYMYMYNVHVHSYTN